MEIRHRISAFNNSPQFDTLKKALDELEIKYELKPLGLGTSCIICFLNDSDTNFTKVKPLIYQKFVTVQTGMHYTKEDLDESEWFYITTSESQYPQGEEDFRCYSYDLSNWCDKCGIGKVQNQPFRLLRDFQQKKDVFFGLHWVFDEFFVRSSVKPILAENGITGISYINPIYHGSGKEIATVFQLKTDFIIQPTLITGDVDASAFLIDRRLWTSQEKYARFCPFCNRVRYRHPQREVIKFKRAAFENVPDIVKGFEYFEGGDLAHRLVLASKKFYDVVKKYKFRGLSFTPIRLE